MLTNKIFNASALRNYLYARFFFLSNLSLLTIKCVFAYYQM